MALFLLDSTWEEVAQWLIHRPIAPSYAFDCSSPFLHLNQLILIEFNFFLENRGIARAGEPSNLVSNSIKENSITNSYLDPDVHATLRRKQRRLVREHPGVVVAVAKGAKQAISECKHQFKNRRWNCHTKDFHRGRNLFGKIVDRGQLTQHSFVLR